MIKLHVDFRQNKAIQNTTFSLPEWSAFPCKFYLCKLENTSRNKNQSICERILKEKKSKISQINQVKYKQADKNSRRTRSMCLLSVIFPAPKPKHGTQRTFKKQFCMNEQINLMFLQSSLWELADFASTVKTQSLACYRRKTK